MYQVVVSAVTAAVYYKLSDGIFRGSDVLSDLILYIDDNRSLRCI